MRSGQEMIELILDTAKKDERIRAVIMQGSRANPHAKRDIFQDFDVVYVVTDLSSFKENPEWIDQFGERMIMQLPDDMDDPPPGEANSYGYLMQFADGNRIDLAIYSRSKLQEFKRDSLSVLLLDKDGTIEPFPVPDEKDYLPGPPTTKNFADCCNEFWWVCPYVAKGLWREEITYAKYMQDQIVRQQLMKMLGWHIGIKTQFQSNPGKFGKYFKQYLEPGLWDMLVETYSDADYERAWNSLEKMCQLFRLTSQSVAEHFGFEYHHEEDKNVSAYLNHVRFLPKDAEEIY